MPKDGARRPMDDGWITIRASDTKQKPPNLPDSILFEYHPRFQIIRIKRGRVMYLVPLKLYVGNEI